MISTYTPCVIGIGADFSSIRHIDSDNISLQIFLEKVFINFISGIACRPVLQPDGRFAFVVQIDQRIRLGSVNINRFFYDLCSVEGIFVTSNLAEYGRSHTQTSYEVLDWGKRFVCF